MFVRLQFLLYCSNFFASEIDQIMWRSQGCPIWEWRNPVSVCCVCKITTRSILSELFPWGGLLHAVLIIIHCLFVCTCVFTMWTNHLWCNTVAAPLMATSPQLPPLQQPPFWWVVPTLYLMLDPEGNNFVSCKSWGTHQDSRENKTNWFPEGPDIKCFVIFLDFHFNSNKRITRANLNSWLGTYKNKNLILKTTEWMIYKVLSLYYLHLIPPTVSLLA